MIHPSTKLIETSDKGLGVVATEFIPRGTITWAKDKYDIVIPRKRFEANHSIMISVIHDYVFLEPNGDAVLCWDYARYINHSCDSKILTSPYDFEIAVEDINEGDEITNDYRYLNIDYYTFNKCKCNSASCTGSISSKDFDKMVVFWDAKLRSAFSNIDDIDQPLYSVLNRVSLNGIISFLNKNKLLSLSTLKLIK